MFLTAEFVKYKIFTVLLDIFIFLMKTQLKMDKCARFLFVLFSFSYKNSKQVGNPSVASVRVRLLGTSSLYWTMTLVL